MLYLFNQYSKSQEKQNGLTHLLAWSCASALHEDRSIWNVNVKEVHFPVHGFDFSLVVNDDMGIVHVLGVRPNFLKMKGENLKLKRSAFPFTYLPYRTVICHQKTALGAKTSELT